MNLQEALEELNELGAGPIIDELENAESCESELDFVNTIQAAAAACRELATKLEELRRRVNVTRQGGVS